MLQKGGLAPVSVIQSALGFDVEFGAGSDYWLYCLSTTIEPRLFVDFNADACVIIKDREAFRSRLAKAASPTLDHAELREGHADYVDPLFPRATIPFVPLAKYFGYAYQAEYRFCWMLHQKAETLQHHDLELGSLTDIADLILLD